MRPTGSAILADYFEGPGFGRVNGVAMMGFALCGSAGPWTTGALFDLQGSYLWGLVGLRAHVFPMRLLRRVARLGETG